MIDDEEYVDKVTEASARLLEDGKLKSLDSLRSQVRAGGLPLKLMPVSREKLAAPELCDRLRQSTLAVGSYYKCPDCGEWHFNSSAGFVVGEGGIICTCCHVVQAEDEGVKESYLIAADDAGRVFPVKSVLAADTESDTCFVKIDAPGLKPLPLRPGVRAGERVYCLSHPGGYFFMFTQGMVARVNLQAQRGPRRARPHQRAAHPPDPVPERHGGVRARVQWRADCRRGRQRRCPSSEHRRGWRTRHRRHQRSPFTQRAGALLHRCRGNPAPDPAEHPGRP